MSIYLVISCYVFFSVTPTNPYPVLQISPVSVAPDISSTWKVSVSPHLTKAEFLVS